MSKQRRVRRSRPASFQRMIERCESPIEVRLLKALYHLGGGFRVSNQVPLAEYRVDFLLTLASEEGEKSLVVEADGEEFHATDEQRSRDEQRDADILRAAGLRTVRFSGSEINKNANRCAKYAADALLGVPVPVKQRKGWQSYLNRQPRRSALTIKQASVGAAVRNDIRF